MSLTLPDNVRGPILDLELPASEDAIDIVLRNVTTGKSLTVNLPEGWKGDDLRLDWYRRTIADGSGADRSALLDAEDNGLWLEAVPLQAGANDVRVEARSAFLVDDENPFAVAFDTEHAYWTNPGTRIGRAGRDSSKPDPDWLTVKNASGGLAVSATHIYWSRTEPARIGRAKIDGTEADGEWLTGPAGASGLALDATYIYWCDGGAIGRAKLDGTGVNATWLEAPAGAAYVAVSATHIYWSDSTLGAIGRAKIDGTEADGEWLTTPTKPVGLAVDATHIYWGDNTLGTVGRAELDGSNPESEWRDAALASGGLAASGGGIYWVNRSTHRIERAAMAYAAKVTLRWERGYY